MLRRLVWGVAAAAVFVWLAGGQLIVDSHAEDSAGGTTTVTHSGHPLPTTGTTESRIGPLAFEGGYPTDTTVAKLYDEMDF